MLAENKITELLRFWFPNNDYNKFWFEKNEIFDNYIKDTYYNLLLEINNKIKTMEISEFENFNSKEIVAMIVLLDQFSRNIERVIDKVNVRDFTETAEKLSKFWVSKKYYLVQPINYVVFALMPLRHLNKLHDYNIILDILEKIKDESNVLYNKFKNQTIKRIKMLQF
jgi:hypothetical protein